MWPNPQKAANLVIFTGEILNGKLNFLCSVLVYILYTYVYWSVNIYVTYLQGSPATTPADCAKREFPRIIPGISKIIILAKEKKNRGFMLVIVNFPLGSCYLKVLISYISLYTFCKDLVSL